jgi:hypothetical protein
MSQLNMEKLQFSVAAVLTDRFDPVIHKSDTGT